MIKDLAGKTFSIAGMRLEVIEEEGDRWKTRNTTTNEIVYLKKSMLDQAIRFGQAEEVE